MQRQRQPQERQNGKRMVATSGRGRGGGPLHEATLSSSDSGEASSNVFDTLEGANTPISPEGLKNLLHSGTSSSYSTGGSSTDSTKSCQQSSSTSSPPPGEEEEGNTKKKPAPTEVVEVADPVKDQTTTKPAPAPLTPQLESLRTHCQQRIAHFQSLQLQTRLKTQTLNYILILQSHKGLNHFYRQFETHKDYWGRFSFDAVVRCP